MQPPRRPQHVLDGVIDVEVEFNVSEDDGQDPIGSNERTARGSIELEGDLQLLVTIADADPEMDALVAITKLEPEQAHDLALALLTSADRASRPSDQQLLEMHLDAAGVTVEAVRPD